MYIEHSARDVRLLEQISNGYYEQKNKNTSEDGTHDENIRYKVIPGGYSWTIRNVTECSATCGGGVSSGKVDCVTFWKLIALLPSETLYESMSRNSSSDFAIKFSDVITKTLVDNMKKTRPKRDVKNTDDNLSYAFHTNEEKDVSIGGHFYIKANKTIYTNGVEEVKVRLKRSADLHGDVELLYFDEKNDSLRSIQFNTSDHSRNTYNKHNTGRSQEINEDAVFVDVDELRRLFDVEEDKQNNSNIDSDTKSESKVDAKDNSSNDLRETVVSPNLCDTNERPADSWGCNYEPCFTES